MAITWQQVRKVWVVSGITATVLFSGWMLLGYQARGFEDSVMESDGRVEVAIDSDHISFIPRQSFRSSGLLFFSGGLVDPQAYAPLARRIAEAGYTAVIVKLPFRMAMLESQEVEAISRSLRAIEMNPGVERWVVGGHSKGGMLAARFARDHADGLSALVLIGTTGPKDFTLSHLTVPVTKIYGTADGIATVEGIRKNAHLLPPTTRWVEIAGGNHAQFGWYGQQFGDRTASISREEQQEQTIRTLLDALALQE